MATNPFTLDYAQFLEAMKPYASADGSAYQWASPEGQNGSVGLTLADGKTWTPSGANSGVKYHPVGEPIMGYRNTITGQLSKTITGRRDDWEPAQIGTNQKETWDVSGDMSSLLGKNDSNAHKNITYEKQGNQLVPVDTKDWQYQNGGLGGFIKDVVTNPALLAFGGIAGAGLLSGLGGSGAASTATGFGGVGTDAAVMGTGGGLGLTPEIAAQYAGLGGAVSSPVVAGAVESSVLPALATEVAPGSGLLSGGISTAPMGFGTAAATDAQLAAAVGTGTGASMNLLDLLPAGVKDVAQFAKDNAGLLGALGGAIASGQDQTQSTTASKEPWSAAAPWMKSNIATGQELQKWYQSNPFNAQQMGAYQNLFNGVDNFNQSTMPALTDFANRGMNTAYQRPRIGAVGTGGGYGGDVQPGGLLSTGGRGFSAPQMQSLGQIDWTKVNPFVKG